MSPERVIVDESCSVHGQDVGYMHGLEWALSLIDKGLGLDDLRLLLRAKASEISDGLRAEQVGLLTDLARLKHDAEIERDSPK